MTLSGWPVSGVLMRDDWDRDAWTGWNDVPATVPFPIAEPYPCRLCGVEVRGPADPRHDYAQHVPPAA